MSHLPIDRPGFTCTQCGRCCFLPDAFSLSADIADIERWQEEGREDILEYADEITPDVVDLWINPNSGEECLDRCPWFRKVRNETKFYCTIHETKPTHCHEFPRNQEHAWKCGCPGWGLPPEGWKHPDGHVSPLTGRPPISIRLIGK